MTNAQPEIYTVTNQPYKDAYLTPNARTVVVPYFIIRMVGTKVDTVTLVEQNGQYTNNREDNTPYNENIFERRKVMIKLLTKKDKRTVAEKCVDKKIEELAGKMESIEEVKDVVGLMESRSPKKEKIKKETLILVAGNLIGILLILCFERLNIITSKAIGFVMKGRA